MKKKARDWFAIALRPSLLFGVIGGVVICLLWFQLGSLVPGMSEAELAMRGTSKSAQVISENPLGLPHKLLQLVPQHFHHHGPLAMRSASALVGLFIVGCFYYVLSSWYTRRVAILGTLLFATSSWFLHSARLGTDTIQSTLLFATIASVAWLQKSRGSTLAMLTSAALVLSLIYLPGMIWFVVPAIFWQSRRILRILADQRRILLGLVAIATVLALVPLGWAMYQQPQLLRTFFGLPQDFPPLLDVVKNIAQVPLQILVRGPSDPSFNLARLPLLDWFGVVMFVVGIYAYFFKRRLDRTWLIAYVGGMGMVLAGISGPVHISLLLPFIYLVIAGGIALMLQQWFTVFPFNPVARTLGPTLMTLAVLMSGYYNISHYFIAWPNAPETKAVFVHKE